METLIQMSGLGKRTLGEQTPHYGFLVLLYGSVAFVMFPKGKVLILYSVPIILYRSDFSVLIELLPLMASGYGSEL